MEKIGTSTSLYDKILQDLKALDAHIGIAYVKSDRGVLNKVEAAIFANSQPEYCDSTFLGIADIGLLHEDSQLHDGDIIDLSSLVFQQYRITLAQGDFWSSSKYRYRDYLLAKKFPYPCDYTIEEVSKLQPPHDYRFVYGNDICKAKLKILKIWFVGYKSTNLYKEIYDIQLCQGKELIGAELTTDGVRRKLVFYAKMRRDSDKNKKGDIVELKSPFETYRIIHLFKETRLKMGDFIDLSTFCKIDKYTPCGLDRSYEYEDVYDAMPIEKQDIIHYHEILNYKFGRIQDLKKALMQNSLDFEYLLQVFSVNAYNDNKNIADFIKYDECRKPNTDNEETRYIYHYEGKNIIAYYDKSGLFSHIEYDLSRHVFYLLADMLSKYAQIISYSPKSETLHSRDMSQGRTTTYVFEDKKIGLYIRTEYDYMDDYRMCNDSNIPDTFYYIKIMLNDICIEQE